MVVLKGTDFLRPPLGTEDTNEGERNSISFEAIFSTDLSKRGSYGRWGIVSIYSVKPTGRSSNSLTISYPTSEDRH